jgi:hypothetical protein
MHIQSIAQKIVRQQWFYKWLLESRNVVAIITCSSSVGTVLPTVGVFPAASVPSCTGLAFCVSAWCVFLQVLLVGLCCSCFLFIQCMLVFYKLVS